MAQQDFDFVWDAVVIAVLPGNSLQPCCDIRFAAGLRKLPGNKPQPVAEVIVRKLIETFGRFVFAWQMTRRALGKAFGEKPVVMPFEARFVRRSCPKERTCKENGHSRRTG